MAHVVRRVMDGLDMREASESDNEQAEKCGETDLGQARSRGNGCLDRERLLSVHLPSFVLHPRTLRGTSDAGRSPGSRISVFPLAFPEKPSGASRNTLRLQLRGQPRHWAKVARTAFPFSSPRGDPTSQL